MEWDCTDRYTQRWSLMRDIHRLSHRGSVKDIRWKSKGVIYRMSISELRLEEGEFVQRVVGFLGFGDLVRGNFLIQPLLQKLHSLLELQPLDDNKADIREFLAGMFILEYKNLFDRPIRVLEILFELFDVRGENWLTRNETFRMCMSMAADTQHAEQVHKFSLLVCEDNISRIRWKHILRVLDPSWGRTLELALRHCLPNEEMLQITYAEQMLALKGVYRKVRLTHSRAILHQMVWFKARAAFETWSTYAVERVQKRFERKYGTTYYENKVRRLALRKLRRWSRLKQERYPLYLKADLKYADILIRRSMERFKKMHRYYAPLRAARESEKGGKICRMVDLLQLYRKRLLLRNRDYSMFIWWNMNRHFNERLSRAVSHHKTTLLWKTWRPWVEAGKAFHTAKVNERLRFETQTYLSGVSKEANLAILKLRQLEEEQAAKEKAQVRIAEKYRLKLEADAARFQQKQEDLQILKMQRKERRKRVARQLKDIQIRLEEKRSLLRMECREESKYLVEATDQGQRKVAKYTKAIQDSIKRKPNRELIIEQEQMLKQFGGDLDAQIEKDVKNEEIVLEREQSGSQRDSADEEEEKDDSNEEEESDEDEDEEEENAESKARDEEADELDDMDDTRLKVKLTHTASIDKKTKGVTKLVSVSLVYVANPEKVVPPNTAFKDLVSKFCVEWQLIEEDVLKAQKRIETQSEEYEIELHHNYAASTIQQAWYRCQKRRELFQNIQTDIERRREYSAKVIQQSWRTRSSWKRMFKRIFEVYFERVDPVSGNTYFINSVTGFWDWEPPIFLQSSTQSIKRTANPWILRYDSDNNHNYYRNEETKETSLTIPFGYDICVQCQVDFTERFCKDCRYVENGELRVPGYCIPCWVQEHGRHEYENDQNLF